jgi:hypothetical protein
MPKLEDKMPNRSYPRSLPGGPICIRRLDRPGNLARYIPLSSANDILSIATPGLFNQAAANRHIASHERLFIDKYGQHLMQVPKGQWGQPPA